MSITKVEVQGVNGHMDHDKGRNARRKWSHGP